MNGSTKKLIYSNNAKIIINDIEVAITVALPDFFKNNVTDNKIRKNKISDK